MTEKEMLDQFEDVRNEYNQELKELRDKYEPKFQELLQKEKEVKKNESASGQAD